MSRFIALLCALLALAGCAQNPPGAEPSASSANNLSNASSNAKDDDTSEPPSPNQSEYRAGWGQFLSDDEIMVSVYTDEQDGTGIMKLYRYDIRENQATFFAERPFEYYSKSFWDISNMRYFDYDAGLVEQLNRQGNVVSAEPFVPVKELDIDSADWFFVDFDYNLYVHSSKQKRKVTISNLMTGEEIWNSEQFEVLNGLAYFSGYTLDETHIYFSGAFSDYDFQGVMVDIHDEQKTVFIDGGDECHYTSEGVVISFTRHEEKRANWLFISVSDNDLIMDFKPFPIGLSNPTLMYAIYDTPYLYMYDPDSGVKGLALIHVLDFNLNLIATYQVPEDILSTLDLKFSPGGTKIFSKANEARVYDMQKEETIYLNTEKLANTESSEQQ